MGSTNEQTKGLPEAKSKLDFDAGNTEDSPESRLEGSDESSEGNENTCNGRGDKSTKKVTLSVDIIGANARARNDSESSTDSAKSPSLESMKRQRTFDGSSPIQNFIFPGVPASPPKFMSLEEVMKAAKSVSNMVLAHEIAVDKNFKLEKFDPPENSLEKKVRDTMHRAFWDNMKEQLSQTPPCYDQAFVLLKEVRDNLLDITLPHHTRLRQEITEKFDVELIKQQAEHCVLNFDEYSQYVLSIMARLCAPVRDGDIQKMMQEKDVVTVFRGVMETLDLMRLDMANYTIQQIRPHIIAQSVDYERTKFAEFLKTQNDGLEITREWLTKHIQSDDLEVSDEVAMRAVVNKVISKSYLHLLSWPDGKLLPETVVLDGSRVLELRDRLTQVCMMGTVLLVALSSLGPILPKPDEVKKKLKKNICSILDPAFSEKETYDLMENISEQVIKDVSDHLIENNKPPLALAASNALKSQLLDIKNSDQRIRQLITSRAQEFIGSLLTSTTARPVQIPMGLSSLQEELAHICGTLLRLVSHNRAVFGEYYADIIVKHIKAAQSMPKVTDATEEGYKGLAAELELD